MRKKSIGDIPTPFVLREPTLTRRSSGPRQERPRRQLPKSGKLVRQPLGGVMSALELSVRIAWNEHDTGRVRSGQRFADDRPCPGGQPAQTALLPGGHHRTQPVVVRQRRPSTSEGQPPARALCAALHRPGSRGAATLAERCLDTAEGRGAAVAHLRPGDETEKAALGQEQIEHATSR